MANRNNSILQQDASTCYLCKGDPEFFDPLAKHHIFGGCKAIRDKADKYGLVVFIHNNKCHIYGDNAVHRNARVNRALQAEAQKAAMERNGWTVEDFRREFYKNYIEEDSE